MDVQNVQDEEAEKDESITPIETVIHTMLQLHYNQVEEQKNKHS